MADRGSATDGTLPQPPRIPAKCVVYASKNLNMNSDTLITTISGSASGFAATFAKQPIQRIKWIRQVHEGPAIPYRNIFRDTYANIGLRGFFNGSMAAIYRNVPHSTLAYTIYPKAETLVFRLQKWLGQDEPDSASRKRNFTTRFGAGYITLFGATLITHPLDTLRVRLSVHASAAREGVFSTGRAMMAAEGPQAFYRGFGATLIGAGPRGALGFGVFETLKPILEEPGGRLEHHKGAAKFLCGYLAGLASEFFTYPLDTVRRRQQALGDSASIGRRNVVEALRHIWKTEKLLGMYKGISLNLIKNPLATAVSFLVNDLVKEHLGFVGASDRAGD